MAIEWTPERRQAFADKMKAARNKNKDVADVVGVPLPVGTGTPPQVDEIKVPQGQPIDTPAEVQGSADEQALREQIKSLQANQELMMLLLKGQGQAGNANGLSVGTGGKLVGEIEKYTVDFDKYADPTIRLKDEPRLQPLAFNFNYELDYDVTVRSYETKTGVNQKEPEFYITLSRIRLDDDGEQTDRRIIIKRLIFHEDPQAAMVIARENGIYIGEFTDVDNTTDNQTLFLNEMRYLRVKAWLFDIFWPKPASKKLDTSEESIGGTIVQVYTKSSVEPSGIDFDKIKTVLR